MDAISEEELRGAAADGTKELVRLPAVQLRVVGESLGILQEFSQTLELTCAAEGKTCRVVFRNGAFRHMAIDL